MRIEQEYLIAQSNAISCLEDLAETFIEPGIRKTNTIKGLLQGKSRDAQRKLWPKRFRTRDNYNFATGLNYPTFDAILRGAKKIQQTGRFDYSGRLMLDDLLRCNLSDGENLQQALLRYEVLYRDDYCWYVWLYYGDQRLRAALGDNTVWDKPDQKFEQLYNRLFGNIFESYSQKP